jgi:excisionase family DNA binding protein
MTGYRTVQRTSRVTPQLLRPEEAAIALNISRTAVYGFIASGELASITIGRRRRVPQTAVDKFIAARLAGSGEQNAG